MGMQVQDPRTWQETSSSGRDLLNAMLQQILFAFGRFTKRDRSLNLNGELICPDASWRLK